MPILTDKSYRNPWYLMNGHFETVIPSIWNKAPQVSYERERLELEDGDFLDLDWLRADRKKVVIISHGLEGSSDRHYVRRPAAYFHRRGWSVLAWNCRSCSGDMNRKPRFYHHGATEDLGQVVAQCLSTGFETVVLMGFSMGGSMTLKYLGESSRPPEIKGAVTFSVPCNLKDSALALERKANRFYQTRFLKKLKKKILLKSEIHSEIDVAGLEKMTRFDDFHHRYTVPLHGFSSLNQFYQEATCDQFFEGVTVPTLIVNALNDPLLQGGCYPLAATEASKNIFLKTPTKGGHVGFTKTATSSWMELQASWFMEEYLGLV